MSLCPKSALKPFLFCLTALALGEVAASSESSLTSEEESLRSYSLDEVSRHDSLDNGVWVTYRGFVYDVTDFLRCKQHPGGNEFLMRAAGGAIDDYWSIWAAHYRNDRALTLLKGMRIGRISDYNGNTSDMTRPNVDYYADDPVRSLEGSLPFQVTPYETVTLANVLQETYYTPNDHFYVRNHAPVPHLEPDSHMVKLITCEGRQIDVKLSEIEQMQKKEITSVMQCAGNRGPENSLDDQRKTFISWTNKYSDKNSFIGMVGNVEWTGVPIVDLFQTYYPAYKSCDCSHIVFEGEDDYSTSTPLSHVIDPSNDVLLATQMNGAPLPLDHGYPIRVALPGIAGSRNVKWLRSIRFSKEESGSPWQQHFYKTKDGQSLQYLPINSIITSHCNDYLVNPGGFLVKGIAYSGARGSEIAAVEVSLDEGQTWRDAKIVRPHKMNPLQSKHWGWVQWEIEAKQNANQSSPVMQVWCRARAKNGDAQPERVYNPNLYLYNGWHKISVMNEGAMDSNNNAE